MLVLAATSVWGQADERAKGIELYRAGNFAEAIDVLNKVVVADPKDKVAWTYLGGALANTRKLKEAEAAFKKPVGGPKFDDNLESDLKIRRKVGAPYTEEARSNGETGGVEIMVEFRSDGKIGFVIPIKRLRFGLTENAIRAAQSISFDPPVKNGKPVTVIKMIYYGFSIY